MSQPNTCHCQIAAKSVTYQVRSGQALGEPRRPYVRCSERDCQYVDVNEPPCPLDVTLFDRTEEKDRLETYLVVNLDRRTCFACVLDAVGLTHDGLRRLAWRLSSDGARVSPGRCHQCRHRRVTITAPTGSALARRRLHAPATPPSSPRRLAVSSPTTQPDAQNSKVTVALATVAGPTCTACLALASGMSLAATRSVVSALAASGELVLKELGICSLCTRRQVVAMTRGGEVETDLNGSVLP